jgi:DNA-binding NtrC family response regulator
MKGKILIVEDEFIEANNLRLILQRAGYDVCSLAKSVKAALAVIEEEKPQLVLLDIYLIGPQTGIDLAKILKEQDIAFVYLSANSNHDILAAAKQTEPYGFLVKPFREKDVLVTLDIAAYLHEQKQKLYTGSALLETPADWHLEAPGIIGTSASLKKAISYAQIVAPTETSVLILGESGTGKEKMVNLIHELSPRKKKNLIKVNCAALPESLIESELFGHERGSFTGAVNRHLGRFEQAEGGTIFLDEIGELPLGTQVKLLRVLQEKEIERLGGESVIRLNVRIITATNKDLEKEVAEGRFRIDLYYRLNVFPITVPPLRERKVDIPLLATYFLRQFARSNGMPPRTLTWNAMDALTRYDWPGNVRELENTIERMTILATSEQIDEVDFLPLARAEAPDQIQRHIEYIGIKTMAETEAELILAALTKSNGKLSGQGGAAELLKIPYSTLTSKLKKFGISVPRSYK